MVIVATKKNNRITHVQKGEKISLELYKDGTTGNNPFGSNDNSTIK